jgi:uncharacterized protein (TIGR02996 family)
MRQFKYTDDKSDKFWNIELEGSSYTVHFGRVGTKGQARTKDFPSPEAARKAHDKIIAEKRAEGYAEIAAAAAPTATTENVLERALLDDPDDVAAHSAYADWLSQEGDPRGEFIQVQLALEDPGRRPEERKALQKREKVLLEAHAGEWLGGLADFLVGQRRVDPGDWRQRGRGSYEFQFACGWLDSINVPSLSVEFARALVRAPQARLLRRLMIEGERYEEEGEYEAGDDIPTLRDLIYPGQPSVHVLLGCPYLTNLRVFHLGEPTEGENANCHTSGEAAAELVAGMPRLEELYLLAHHVDMERLFALKNLTKLRILQIYHNRQYPLEVMAANPTFKKLSHLILFPHALEHGEEAYITLDGVRALAHSPHLRSLTHLQLRSSDLGDEGCEEIVRSGILRRLKTLDLMYGLISDRGAEVLAGCPDLRNLERLDVSSNRIGEAGIAALKRACAAKVVKNAGQYDPETDDWEVLWQGDIE